MVSAAILRSSGPGHLSLGAFALSVAGVAAATAFIFASQDDPWDVRWWLVVAPVVITAFPLLVQGNAARLFAALLLTAWCVVAIFSIGMLLLPAAFVQYVAWFRERS